MTLRTLAHALARTELAMGAGLLLTEIGLALSTLALRIAAAGLEISSKRLGTAGFSSRWTGEEQRLIDRLIRDKLEHGE
jgi:hypothetical protein